MTIADLIEQARVAAEVCKMRAAPPYRIEEHERMAHLQDAGLFRLLADALAAAHGGLQSIMDAPPDHGRSSLRFLADKALSGFPQPAPQETPCGECHLPAGEVCNICGARQP